MLAGSEILNDTETLVDSLVVPESHSDLFMRMNNLATAIQLNRDDQEAHRALINVLMTLGYNREAKLICERALSLAPEDADFHVRYAKCLLSLNEYEAGWREYTWRSKLKHYPAAPTKGQLWDRIARKNQSLLLIADTSIAETILNMRYCNLFSEHGMQVIVQAPREWHRYLCAIPGISQCVNDINEVAVDWYFPIASLPQMFNVKADDVMAVEQYVFPPDAVLIPWLKHFSADSEKLKIGISWRGDNDGPVCPLSSLEPLVQIPDSCVVSLVRQPSSEEKAWLDQHGVRQVLNDSHDWFDVATCARALDLVIAVEGDCLSAVAAIGMPTWGWHQPMPEWMWCLGSRNNAWYPRVKSVRQTRINEWASLVDASYRTLMRAIQETGLS